VPAPSPFPPSSGFLRDLGDVPLPSILRLEATPTSFFLVPLPESNKEVYFVASHDDDVSPFVMTIVRQSLPIRSPFRSSLRPPLSEFFFFTCLTLLDFQSFCLFPAWRRSTGGVLDFSLPHHATACFDDATSFCWSSWAPAFGTSLNFYFHVPGTPEA